MTGPTRRSPVSAGPSAEPAFQPAQGCVSIRHAAREPSLLSLRWLVCHLSSGPRTACGQLRPPGEQRHSSKGPQTWERPRGLGWRQEKGGRRQTRPGVQKATPSQAALARCSSKLQDGGWAEIKPGAENWGELGGRGGWRGCQGAVQAKGTRGPLPSRTVIGKPRGWGGGTAPGGG